MTSKAALKKSYRKKRKQDKQSQEHRKQQTYYKSGWAQWKLEKKQTLNSVSHQTSKLIT